MSHLLIHANAELLATLVLASVAMLAVAIIVERLARGVSAPSRHTILVAAMLAPPLLIAAAAVPSSEPAPAAGRIATATIATITFENRFTELACALAALWFLGFAVAIARSVRSAMHWRGVARRAEQRDGFAVSTECEEPMVIGILDPKIILPGGAYIETLTSAELDAVFAHERAHIARRDNLVAALVQLASAAFWFDPLHRLARRRLIALREHACDEAVLAAGCDPDSYLTALARSCDTSFRSSAVACMSRLHLYERMESIMTRRNERHLPAWIVRTATIIAIGIIAVGFSLVAPAPRVGASTNYTKLTSAMKPPKLIERVEPLYPEKAKEAALEGKVILEVMLSDRGAVDEVRVVKSLSKDFDDAATEAVRQWRFEPAMMDEKPVAVSLKITINFKLT
jgi:TonB family protein